MTSRDSSAVLHSQPLSRKCKGPRDLRHHLGTEAGKDLERMLTVGQAHCIADLGRFFTWMQCFRCWTLQASLALWVDRRMDTLWRKASAGTQ